MKRFRSSTAVQPALNARSRLRRSSLLSLSLVLVGLFLVASCAQHDVGQAAGHSVSPDATDVDPDGLVNGKSTFELADEIVDACMSEFGWLPIEDGPGAGGVTVPEGQGDQYDANLEECVAEASATFPPAPMSERAIRERYSLELEARLCLMQQGYEISEPPSEQAWVEQFAGDISASPLWLPYFEIITDPAVSQATLAELRVACPGPANRVYAE
ncbi:hypothetical protein ESZ53_09810 [Salinibacterium sp. UTAS2018]|uniref:hypothetical protein n=1 Tax=Salinibacterium sp. UTAS2018 TaxID=2508880 RepID=UPI00100967AF|nr:hypothetical protein [Salinibacterium sp. UTAS2018]QAV70704.1 hypothetical protein ESZ53_09810 [Salinibacterium sp. UTAS2018]